jgi:hypothetical protein
MPINVHIVHHRVQTRVDVVCLVCWEDDISSTTAPFEGGEYSWYIVCRVALPGVHCASRSPTEVRGRDMLRYRLRDG